jgi:hypothetical protein
MREGEKKKKKRGRKHYFDDEQGHQKMEIVMGFWWGCGW